MGPAPVWQVSSYRENVWTHTETDAEKAATGPPSATLRGPSPSRDLTKPIPVPQAAQPVALGGENVQTNAGGQSCEDWTHEGRVSVEGPQAAFPRPGRRSHAQRATRPRFPEGPALLGTSPQGSPVPCPGSPSPGGGRAVAGPPRGVRARAAAVTPRTVGSSGGWPPGRDPLSAPSSPPSPSYFNEINFQLNRLSSDSFIPLPSGLLMLPRKLVALFVSVDLSIVYDFCRHNHNIYFSQQTNSSGDLEKGDSRPQPPPPLGPQPHHFSLP